jgi:hypothetical protein
MTISLRSALAAARFPSAATATLRVPRDLQATHRTNGVLRLRPMLERMLLDPQMDGWGVHATTEHANKEYSDHAQGIACDGTSWYISQDDGADDRGVYKLTLDSTQELARWRPGTSLGNHLGDIDCGIFQGQPCIYVPYEETPLGHGRVAILDRGLAFIAAHYLKAADGGPPPTGEKAPWIAFNPGNGLVYTSGYYQVQRLEAYDPAHEFRHVPEESITLDRICNEVQGGAFNSSGHVFISCAATPTVYGFSTFTGALLGAAALPLNTGEGEVGEGLCWAPLVVSGQPCALHVGIHDWDVVEDDLLVRHFVTGGLG